MPMKPPTGVNFKFGQPMIRVEWTTFKNIWTCIAETLTKKSPELSLCHPTDMPVEAAVLESCPERSRVTFGIPEIESNG